MRKELDELVEKYDLINRTFDSFRKSYDNYLTDDITKEEAAEAGFTDKDTIIPELECYSFVVSKKFSRDYIAVTLECHREGETLCCITYWVIYDLDGNDYDDYFVTK